MLPSTATMKVKVAASVSLKSSSAHVTSGKKVTLTATVAPSDTGGSVVFEYLKSGSWHSIGTKAVSATGSATQTWSVPKGAWHVRARFTGSSINSAKTSKKVTVAGE